ncbi:MAG TPA: N-formylglutamate amidohydrolase [Acetobacteraceae bacterium]|nr:N-formylglutamate amidohydrolase [Acetobacteraceae bacterium]
MSELPTLLAPGEPDPVRLLNPEGQSAFVLIADHAGREIPRSLARLGVPESELLRHIAWDIGIAGVTERLADTLDAVAVLQRYSRLVIDCNRDPASPTSIPEISEHTPIPGNTGLKPAQRQARVDAVFRPYHDHIARLLDARAASGRRTVLIAMHSFTPVFKGQTRGMHVGVLYHHEQRLAHIMLELLRAEGDLVVGDNAPYAITDTSDYAVPVHGEARGLPLVELEIRQDLIAEPGGQAAWAARLARLLPEAAKRLG